MILHIIWILIKIYLVCTWICACIMYGNLSTMDQYNGRLNTFKCFLMISLISFIAWFMILIRNPYINRKMTGRTYQETLQSQFSLIAVFLDTIFED